MVHFVHLAPESTGVHFAVHPVHLCPFSPFCPLESQSPGPGSPSYRAHCFREPDACHHFVDGFLCVWALVWCARIEWDEFCVCNAAFDLLEQCANMGQFFLEDTNVFQLSHFRNEIFRDTPDFLPSTIN